MLSFVLSSSASASIVFHIDMVLDFTLVNRNHQSDRRDAEFGGLVVLSYESQIARSLL
jgi:hypothetical protein